MNLLCESGHKQWRFISSQPEAIGGRVLFAQEERNWISSWSYPAKVSGRVFFIHAGRNIHWWLGEQRTLCFFSHTKARTNYLLFRKLGHSLHAVTVATLHFFILRHANSQCDLSTTRAVFVFFILGRPAGSRAGHIVAFLARLHPLGVCSRQIRRQAI